MKAYFFGCWNDSGHYLFAPNKVSVFGVEGTRIEYGSAQIHLDSNWAPRRNRYDGTLCWQAQGVTHEERQKIHYRSDECPQGQFLRHERDGYTLISWWDRTQGDTRGNCNSTFLLEGTLHDSATMLVELERLFPHIVANLKRAGVELVEVTP